MTSLSVAANTTPFSLVNPQLVMFRAGPERDSRLRTQQDRAAHLLPAGRTVHRLYPRRRQRLHLQEELLAQKQQKEEQTRLITALASDYWSVYYLDLDNDTGVWLILLTNRVHYGRDRDIFFVRRRLFHDTVFG